MSVRVAFVHKKIQSSDFVYSLEKSIALLHPLADSEFVTSRAQQVIKYFATFPNGSPAVSKVTRRHLCVCVCVCVCECVCACARVLVCVC